jgi:hypothetical protein
MARVSSVLRGLVVVWVCGWASSSLAQSSIGIEGGLFFDASTAKDETVVGPIRDTERADLSNRDLGHVALYYLHALDEKHGFRLGGELRYLGTLATENDDDEKAVLGPMLEIGARGEWSTPLTEKLTFLVSLRASLALVFPEGELAEEIDRMAVDGIPAGDGPRPGVTLMPSVGARYAIHERVNAGLSLGLGWTFLSIFDLDEQVSGITYSRASTLSATRFELTVGLEVTL